MSTLDEDHRIRLLLKPERQKLALSMVKAMLEASYLHGLFRSCLNCTHFDEPSECCKMASPPMRPPARVIATGCASHTDNIPF